MFQFLVFAVQSVCPVLLFGIPWAAAQGLPSE